MSFCSFPYDDSPEQFDQKLCNVLNDPTWSLSSLADMVLGGNSLEDLREHIPFRRKRCDKSLRCCGACTRKCYNRCIQDCLTRLYMWRQLYENTPEDQRDQLPLGLRMAVTKHYDSAEQLSAVVGEYISVLGNRDLKEYMRQTGTSYKDHPNKLNYEPTPMIDSRSGKRITDPETGRISFLKWPLSGMCPYCMPKSAMDRRYGKRYER